LQRLEGQTVGNALDQYEQYLNDKGNKPVSTTETLRRLKLFFPDHQLQVNRLTIDKAQALYNRFCVGRSVDYHRNTLAESKTFLKWCVEKRYASESPMQAVNGVGRRNTGKPQLTGDEARRFHAIALQRIERGDAGALGVEIALLMGLRNLEVCKRRVRDLDLGGSVLRIEDAKTRKGNRIVSVPEALQPYLVRLAYRRAPFAYLFATPNGEMHTKSWLRQASKRICKAARVPYVCPHGLRGTFASLAERVNVASHAVADHLGHESLRTTHGHYADPAAVEAGRQTRTLEVLLGRRNERLKGPSGVHFGGTIGGTGGGRRKSDRKSSMI
jgi:integrase